MSQKTTDPYSQNKIVPPTEGTTPKQEDHASEDELEGELTLVPCTLQKSKREDKVYDRFVCERFPSLYVKKKPPQKNMTQPKQQTRDKEKVPKQMQ